MAIKRPTKTEIFAACLVANLARNPSSKRTSIEFETDDAKERVVKTFCAVTNRAQTFDFGRMDNLPNVDRKLAAELWRAKLLQLPYPETIFTWTIGEGDDEIRITLVCANEIEISSPGQLPQSSCAYVALGQAKDQPLIAQGFGWFSIQNDRELLFGCICLHEGANEEVFSDSMLRCCLRLLTLSMALNIKGLKRHNEPAPIKLNEKRARSGKPPIDAVTRIDLTPLHDHWCGKGSGGEKAMHWRRGHIRHFADGSQSWVRDCLVKSDGELKERTAYITKVNP